MVLTMQGQYNLQVTANIHNITGSEKNYIMQLIVVSEGSIKIVGTEVSKSVGAVVPNNLFEDMNSIEALAYDPQKDFYGGIYTGAGFWDSIKKFARKAVKGVEKIMPYAKQALPFAERAIKYIAPLLAAGYSGDDVSRVIREREPELSDKQINDMINAAGYTGAGVRVESNQLCNQSGGRRAKRSGLRRRQ